MGLFSRNGRCISKGYHKIYDYKEDDEYIIVEKNKLFNIITIRGTEVSKEWFQEIKLHKPIKLFGSNRGKKIIAIVVRTNLYYNYLLNDGTLLIEEDINVTNADWFNSDIANFTTSFNEKGFINLEGNVIIIKSEYNLISGFENGFAMVKKDNKYNYIDREYKLLTNHWFLYATPFTKQGFAFVHTYSKKQNIINSKGQLLFKNKDVSIEIYGSVIIAKDKNTKYVYMVFNDMKKLMNKRIINTVYNYRANVIFIHDDKGFVNAVNLEGKLIFKEWYVDIEIILVRSTPLFVVYKQRENGEIICTLLTIEDKYLYVQKWFDYIEVPYELMGCRIKAKHKGNWYELDLLKRENIRYIGPNKN